jgi:hypothetical protein
MELIERIPFTIDPTELAKKMEFNLRRAGGEDINALVLFAQSLMRPSGVYNVAFIGVRRPDNIEFGGVFFESPLLSKTLVTANKIFPYIITVGSELERAAADQDDLLKQYYLEEIANLALEQAADWLAKHIETRYGLGPLSNMSPGSLVDWPITEQSKLFSVFGDTEKLIGVRLTDSMLMVPRKSISGILFPSEEGFVACQLCDRERCQGRKAPYNGVG